MKNGIYLYVIVFFAVVMTACSGVENGRNEREWQPSDTAYTVDAVMNIYASDPERALTMIDSGVLLGNIGKEKAILMRATVYCYSFDDWPLDTVLQMVEGLLHTDFAINDPDNRQDVLNLLVDISRRRSDNIAYLQWSTEKADFCRHQGEETEALRTDAEIGVALSSMGEVEKGLSKIDGVLGALDNQRHFNEMDAAIIALKRKIAILSELDRSAEVIPLAYRIKEKIDDYRQHYDDYSDGSFREPPDEAKRLDYCDFYTSQAYGYLTRAYAKLGYSNNIIVNKAYIDSARRYLTLFEHSVYAKTLNGKKMASTAYLRLGQYSKVLPIYDEVEARMGSDTVNSDYAAILKARAHIAEAEGNYYAANNYHRRYSSLKEVLNNQLLESRAHDYAARYHLQEEELENETLRVQNEKTRALVIAMFVFALAAVGFIVWLLFQRRTINHKNKVLAEQIASRILDEEPDNTVTDTPQDKPIDINAMSDEELFAYISDYIRTNKLFLNSSLNREMLVSLLKINKNRIGAAFAQGSKYESMNDYIRDLRIEYACKLLTECPELNIGDVASSSGFANATVFGRIFKSRYNVSPSNYRSQNNMQ